VGKDNNFECGYFEMSISKVAGFRPGLPGQKKAKFGHKQFQKRPNPANEKRPNKGQISNKKFVKIAELKFRIS
jgi:hypothetical protein